MSKKVKKMPDSTPTVFDDTGPSSSQTPYVEPVADNVQIMSVLSTGDQVGLKDGPPALAGTPWRMVGIPDGLGAYDNGDGTMTVLMNHELGAGNGVVREHGQTGAFVAKLIVDTATMQVVSAGDLIQAVHYYDRVTDSYVAAPTFNGDLAALGRLCSADLPEISALFDANSGLGTQERIFFSGEEIGNEGRVFAHVATGTEAGHSFELPRLGRFSWENSQANPNSGAKTVVVGMDDSTPGEVYLYVGDKQATGNTIEKAGLTNGKLFGILTSFGDDTAATPQNGTFTLVEQGNNGDVSELTGAAQQAEAVLELTQFGRPEDGHWDPSNPNRYYFVTTGTATIPTRLWAMDFVDVERPELGGTIKALVEGTLAAPAGDPNSPLPFMMDNMTVTDSGLVIMQEDPGNNTRIAKVWMYDPTKDNGIDPLSGLTVIAEHDRDRFTNPSGPTATPAPGSTTGFGQDEESSGVIEVTDMLGNGEKLAFLLDTQAHYAFSPAEFVEGGQLMAMFVDLDNPGDTRFRGGNGNDTFDGGFGDDRLDGGRGNDTLFGNYGDDEIDGEDGNDRLDGGVGNDKIDGGKGDDTITGGTGDDTIKAEDGNDNVDGGVGNDAISGGKGADTLKGSFGNDDLKGEDGNDTLEGGDGNDMLFGGSGNDQLGGGDGGDVLAGGEGHDSLEGGGGDDTFIFNSPAQGPDTIAAFQSGDDLIMLDFDGVNPASVIYAGFADSTASSSAADPTLRYSDLTGELRWDANGGSADDAVLIATLTESPHLHTADVLFI
jgi:Ca2+-binding RTX toxin-like protein